MRRHVRTSALLIAALVLTGAPSFAAGASAQTTQPTVSVDRASVRPGESVVVTLDGWGAEVITLSVCGNQAARGSSDCNLVASEGLRRNRDGSLTRRDFVVTAPSTTCPCVLRASTTTNAEVAVVAIDLIGHPTGPVVLPSGGRRLEVSVDAERASSGLLGRLRSALGGPTDYDVTVTVRNPTSLQVDHVALAASAHGGRGDVGAIDLPDVGGLAPGQSWTRTVRSTVPAPVVGAFGWEVTASGLGRSVTASSESRSLPALLVLLAVVLVADLAAIAWRRIGKRRAAQEAGPADPSELVPASG